MVRHRQDEEVDPSLQVQAFAHAFFGARDQHLVVQLGLADTEVKEARERVRAALLQSGLAFPTNKRITVNLAPADLPKESGRFDLPIALGILAAAGEIDAVFSAAPTPASAAIARADRSAPIA